MWDGKEWKAILNRATRTKKGMPMPVLGLVSQLDWTIKFMKSNSEI